MDEKRPDLQKGPPDPRRGLQSGEVLANLEPMQCLDYTRHLKLTLHISQA